MEVGLLFSGIVFIIASWVVSRKENRDFLRLQERALTNFQENSILELQAEAADLAEQLEEAARGLMAQLDKKSEQIGGLLAQIETAAGGEASEIQPEMELQFEPEPEEIQADPVPEEKAELPVAKGNWEDRERLVKEMSDLGMSSEFIAKELNIGKGEVNLILSLARNEGAAHE